VWFDTILYEQMIHMTCTNTNAKDVISVFKTRIKTGNIVLVLALNHMLQKYVVVAKLNSKGLGPLANTFHSNVPKMRAKMEPIVTALTVGMRFMRQHTN